MDERIMFVTDLAEEVHAFLAREERRRDGVYRRVAPSLFIHHISIGASVHARE